jgi:hypothetical protein
MTQAHFTESVQDEQALDPRFKDLLLHHWMEEQQHAQMDSLMVEELAAKATPAEVDAAIEGFKALGGFLDEGLKMQAALDLDALERACGITLSAEQREAFLTQQHQANRYTYIGSGLQHPRFLETIRRLKPEAIPEFEAMAQALS